MTIITDREDHPVKLSLAAQALGGTGTPVDDSEVIRYEFESLVAVLVFAELVEARGDVVATSHPHHFGRAWRIHVAPALHPEAVHAI